MQWKRKKLCLFAVILGLASLLMPGAAFASTATDGITITDGQGIVWTYAPVADKTDEVQLVYIDIPDSVASITQDNPTDLAIPASITYEGTSYSVTSVAYNSDYAPNQAAGGNTNIFGELYQATTQYPFPYSDTYKVKSLTIPASVVTIGQSTFGGMKNVGSLTFAENAKLETIGNAAFAGMKGLTTLSLPEGLKNIGTSSVGGSFATCTSLTSVTIPASVTYMGFATFGYCSALQTATISDNSLLTVLPQEAFYQDTELTSFSFGSNSKVTTIESAAFQYDDKLTSLVIPASVTTIGNPVGSSPFANCSMDLVFENPANITTLYTAFSGWSKLSDLDISAFTGLQTVERYSFYKNNWSKLVLPNSLITMGMYSFSCGKFETAIVPSKVETVAGLDTNNNLRKVTILSSGDADGSLSFGKYAFANDSALVEIVVSGSPSQIAFANANAFTNDSALAAIVFSGNASNLAMAPVAMFARCPNAVFYAWDAPYDAASSANASLPTWCNTNSRTYKQLVAFPSCMVSGLKTSYLIGDTIDAPVVKSGDVVLTPDTDYTVSYQMQNGDTWVDTTDLTVAGTYRVVVSGALPYYGDESYSNAFTICNDMNTNTVTTDAKCQINTTPAIAVTTAGEIPTTLVPNTDYAISYQMKNGDTWTDAAGLSSAGIYRVVATGKGLYSGITTSDAFTVWTPCMVSGIKKSYKGGSVIDTPVVTTADAATKILIRDTDYTVGWQMWDGDSWIAATNFNAPGTYRVTATSLNSLYADAVSDEFTVWTSFNRLYGQTALDTMASIVDEGWPTGCDTCVVATMGGYWDALTASALAGQEGCPVLLTDGATLSPQTSAEIERLGAKTVYIVGGTESVSADVESLIRGMRSVDSVVRFAGDDASGTALAIYDQGTGHWSKTAVIATSATFQDALAVSPYAYAKDSPVFLAGKATADGSMELSDAVVSAIHDGGFDHVVITGGTASISSDVEAQLAQAGITADSVTRLWGASAYETSSAIADWCVANGMSADHVGIATGESYYDALCGAALCGKDDAALVLVSDGNPSTIDSFIAPNSAKISTGYVFGGTAAISTPLYGKLMTAVA